MLKRSLFIFSLILVSQTNHLTAAASYNHPDCNLRNAPSGYNYTRALAMIAYLEQRNPALASLMEARRSARAAGVPEDQLPTTLAPIIEPVDLNPPSGDELALPSDGDEDNNTNCTFQ